MPSPGICSKQREEAESEKLLTTVLTLISGWLGAKHHAKHFAQITSFSLSNSPVKYVQLFDSVFRCGNWGSEKPGHLSEATLVSDWADFNHQVCLGPQSEDFTALHAAIWTAVTFPPPPKCLFLWLHWVLRHLGSLVTECSCGVQTPSCRMQDV